MRDKQSLPLIWLLSDARNDARRDVLVELEADRRRRLEAIVEHDVLAAAENRRVGLL